MSHWRTFSKYTFRCDGVAAIIPFVEALGSELADIKPMQLDCVTVGGRVPQHIHELN
jgi:hypothetical protein